MIFIIDIFVFNYTKKKYTMEKKIRLIGVECHWFEKDGKFIKARFHSKELIPFHIAERVKKVGVDIINDWVNDNDKDKYWLKPGLEVAHRDNLNTKMYVEKLCKKAFDVEELPKE